MTKHCGVISHVIQREIVNGWVSRCGFVDNVVQLVVELILQQIRNKPK